MLEALALFSIGLADVAQISFVEKELLSQRHIMAVSAHKAPSSRRHADLLVRASI